MSDKPQYETKVVPVKHEPSRPEGYQEKQGQPRLTPGTQSQGSQSSTPKSK